MGPRYIWMTGLAKIKSSQGENLKGDGSVWISISEDAAATLYYALTISQTLLFLKVLAGLWYLLTLPEKKITQYILFCPIYHNKCFCLRYRITDGIGSHHAWAAVAGVSPLRAIVPGSLVLHISKAKSSILRNQSEDHSWYGSISKCCQLNISLAWC